MVDVDHVEAHLFGKKRVVLGDLLHLAEERPREGLDLVGIVSLLVEVADRGHYRGLLGQEFLDLEALERGNEDIRAAVREVNPLYDLGDSPDSMQILGFGPFELVLDHHEADHSIAGEGFIDDFYVFSVAYHDRGEDAGKYRPAGKRNYRQFVRQDLIDRDNLIFSHCVPSFLIYNLNLCVSPRLGNILAAKNRVLDEC